MDHGAHDRARAPRRAALAALVVIAMLGIVYGATRPDGPADAQPAGQTGSQTTDVWEPLRVIGALEAERYPSIAAMRDSADAVVAGSFVSFDTRTFHGDAAEDVIVYLVATLRVDEVLAGSLAQPTVPLEFLVPSVVADDAPVLETLAATLPRSQMVLFLRHKGGAEAGLYRVVNSTGLWAPTKRSGLDTPLAEAAPELAGAYNAELSHVTSMDDFKRLVSDHPGS